MRGARQGAPQRPAFLSVAVLAGCVVSVFALGCAAVAVAARHPDLATEPPGPVSATLQVGAVVACASAALVGLGRPEGRSAALLWLGAAMALAVQIGSPALTGSDVGLTLDLAVAPAFLPLLACAGLLWSGAAGGRMAAATVLVAGVDCGLVLVAAAFFDPARAGCHACARNLVEVVADPAGFGFFTNVEQVFRVGWGIIAAATGMTLLCRAAPATRSVLAPVGISAVGASLTAAVLAGHAWARGFTEVDSLARSVSLTGLGWAVTMGAGVGMGPVLLRRMSRRLVRRLTAEIPDEASLRQSLAKAVGDPTLSLTLIGDQDAPTAGRETLIVHRGSAQAVRISFRTGLPRDKVVAAVRAAALAIGYVAAQRELRQEEARVRELRSRIVATGDAIRRQTERDLHDGAQQQLLAMALTVARLPYAARGSPAAARIQHDLGAAMAQLREIASGIFPAALSDHGLDAALRELQDRSPIPLAIESCPADGTMPHPVRMAAYRLVADCVAGDGPGPGTLSVRCSSTTNPPTLHVRLVATDVAMPDVEKKIWHARDRIEALDGHLDLLSRGPDVWLTAVIECES